MKNKGIFSIILMLFIVLSTAGLAFAAGGGGSGGGSGDVEGICGGGSGNGTPSAKISVAFDKTNVNVGDTIILTVTITNDGKANLTNILVLAPLPDGLQYLSHATLTDKAIYTGGIWDVGNLKTTSKLNGTKYLYITAKVLPSAEGKDLVVTAKYTSLYYNKSGTITPISPLPESESVTIKINKTSTGTGNIAGTGTSTTKTNTTKKTDLKDALKNATSNNAIENLQNLNQPAQGKSYEVNNATTSDSSNDPRTTYAILGGLIITILVAIGYFKGVR